VFCFSFFWSFGTLLPSEERNKAHKETQKKKTKQKKQNEASFHPFARPERRDRREKEARCFFFFFR
jgi:sterol desaturase/sphingolipid hydroxylase (fatty acid hydroxylase superfamily)